MAYRVTLIPGDGTGPEIMKTVREVVDATGVKIDWEIQEAGADVAEKYGTPLPPAVLESVRRNKVAIKGPITTPIGTGFRSVNVALRKELDLYVCLRPCKSYKGVRSKYQDIDLVVVRENTEDLYAGIEWPVGAPESKEVIRLSQNRIREDSAISIKPISRTGSRRIVKFAFDYAVKNGRRKVTAVTKANIMKCTDGLFFDAAREVAKSYEGKIEYEERLIDNMCMQLVQKPELYDVIVLPNLYGDILSDLCAGLVGGLGVAPGANYGDGLAVFEAIHGSAPKYTGQNKVNPSACLLSAMMMLEYLGETAAARRMEQAIAEIFAEGRSVTYDMKPHRDDPTAVGTSQMGQAIIAGMNRAAAAPAAGKKA
ncbi:MAG: isocitrate dehydrogenase [Elusimicrobia bacterium RIFCSPLOWO2_01_FULL_64_13]|nr:MAG: isocitrate dehydrogenase [Elusimicrobia bacterium RIFCSPLOWO2_01_FULL_64_13]